MQSWTLLTVWGNHGQFRWYAEAQPRVSISQGRMERLLVRPAIGIQLSPVVSIWAGYAWTPSFNPSFRDEQRPFQQFLAEHRLGVASLVNRFRLEERFIGAAQGVSLRVRHMLRGVIRFAPDSPWGIAVYDELFFTLNSIANGPLAGFDQNRAFFGLNLKIAEWQFEVGYMNNIVNRPEPQIDRMNHNLTAMIVFTVP